MKFKTKSLTLEAQEISRLIHNATTDWFSLPDWIRNAYENGDIPVITPSCVSFIDVSGMMTDARPGDWIIRGEKGGLMFCTGDVFKLLTVPI